MPPFVLLVSMQKIGGVNGGPEADSGERCAGEELPTLRQGRARHRKGEGGVRGDEGEGDEDVVVPFTVLMVYARGEEDGAGMRHARWKDDGGPNSAPAPAVPFFGMDTGLLRCCRCRV